MIIFFEGTDFNSILVGIVIVGVCFAVVIYGLLYILIDILPYLEKIGFRVEKKGEHSIRIIAIPSAINWGNERS